MYGCQQVRIKTSSETRSLIEFICYESNKLTNCGIYYCRQMYFKTGKIPTKFDLHKMFSDNIHFKALHSQVAQNCLTTVAESFKSFLGLVKLVKQGKLNQKPRLPKYRKAGLNLVTFPSQAVKLREGLLRFPLGGKVKAWFGIDCFYLPMPTNIEFKLIREFRILPKNGQLYLELVYKLTEQKPEVSRVNALGIDPGLNNWLTCVSNVGTSFIIGGKRVKSWNQWYNKQIATIKEEKPQGFWSRRLATITEKRNRRMRDAINKTARYILNHCLEHKIGLVVFGWNQGNKDRINLGKQNNQKFVQIPTARLKERLKELLEQYNIRFEETEESYTSQASFLDNDLLPKYGEKPSQWQASGKRVKRGLYRTAALWLINADCNGAANILRKVMANLNLDLSRVSKGILAMPLRVLLN